MPGVSGFASMSNLSVSAHAGVPTTCFGCMSYANMIRSLRVVFIVWNIPLGFTVIPQPGRDGSDGLMVATSNSGLALGSIIFGGGGGSGIVHAVSGVACVRSRGAGVPC